MFIVAEQIYVPEGECLLFDRKNSCPVQSCLFFVNRTNIAHSTLQRHCTENSKQIFPEMKLPGLVPNSYIHASVSDLYIPTIGPPILLQLTDT